ncbi:ABC transporter ATP-binding protein [uncultured Methylovirgula sp.]|uniref:ABC transporter ATP-binding protein n=1 Tax=uncultured Methylovirgula sp. TaxID=1285960 RepID=UPI0026127684|nr:ABC transporter ATP-binding protein [uncultured Methylovirgula sp.]
MSETLVALKSLTKIYPSGTRALEGIDLVVRDGELLTLLGPSGCGKSTLLRLIAGLERPSSGAIEGAVWRPGEIGFVFQAATLMPWADVGANVRLPLRLQKLPRAEIAKRSEAALALVGLAPFAKAYPRELSGGMQMRVSIARALVSRPKLLLMDEPFAAIDEIGRFRLNDDLLRLKKELGTTVVFVTHSIYEAVYLASRIVVMAAQPGRIAGAIAIDPGFRQAPEPRASAAYLEHCSRVAKALAQVTEAQP